MKRIAFFSLLILLCIALVDGCTRNDIDIPLTSAEFMKNIRQNPDVKTLPNGLAYKILRSGPKDGQQPVPGNNLMVIYEGRLPDGSIFDSSDQHGNGTFTQIPLKGLIKGWMEALPLMHVGDQWELYVPAEMGYGDKSAGIIPSNSPLIFKIWLIGISQD